MDHPTKPQDLDSKAWYRQFWPWFIILLPASAVIASLYTVNLAVQTTDSLVVDAELGMDVISAQHVAAGQLAATMGLGAELAINRETGSLNLSMRSREPALAADFPDSVVLRFSHPAFQDRDHSVILQRSAEPGQANYSARLPAIPPGRWYLILESSQGWRMTADLSDGAHGVTFSAGSPANGAHGK